MCVLTDEVMEGVGLGESIDLEYTLHANCMHYCQSRLIGKIVMLTLVELTATGRRLFRLLKKLLIYVYYKLDIGGISFLNG